MHAFTVSTHIPFHLIAMIIMYTVIEIGSVKDTLISLGVDALEILIPGCGWQLT